MLSKLKNNTAIISNSLYELRRDIDYINREI